MGYIQGFLTPVPAANRQAYIDHATRAVPLLKDSGVARFVETWGDDIPAGTTTDFARAVQATDDEIVVFSWFEFASKDACDAATATMMADPRMAAMAAGMPFDATRMIYAGFATLIDSGVRGPTGYVDGYLAPVPQANREAYLAAAHETAAVFRDHGVTRVVENWGVDVPTGEITDFHRAVKVESGETVVFSWLEWPSKDVRDAGWKTLMADDRMTAHTMPFDGRRMVHGGFVPILDR